MVFLNHFQQMKEWSGMRRTCQNTSMLPNLQTNPICQKNWNLHQHRPRQILRAKKKQKKLRNQKQKILEKLKFKQYLNNKLKLILKRWAKHSGKSFKKLLGRSLSWTESNNKMFRKFRKLKSSISLFTYLAYYLTTK